MFFLPTKTNCCETKHRISQTGEAKFIVEIFTEHIALPMHYCVLGFWLLSFQQFTKKKENLCLCNLRLLTRQKDNELLN